MGWFACNAESDYLLSKITLNEKINETKKLNNVSQVRIMESKKLFRSIITTQNPTEKSTGTTS